MGKLLKVLTVFIFLLTIPALIFGLANFKKRELLIGRTSKLERAVIELASTIEKSAPEATNPATHTSWDIDEVTDRPLDAPAESDFWESYEDKLEASAEERLGISPEALSRYYKIGPDGKPVLDHRGLPATEGPGTMAEVIKNATERAKEQYTLLGQTRNQLIAVREKLEEVAELLNEEKRLRRASLAEIKTLKEKIASLEDTIVQKDAEIARVNREKDDLQDQNNSLTNTIAERDQEIQSLNATIAQLKEEITRLSVDHGDGARSSGMGGGKGKGDILLAPGDKGVITRVEKEDAFVIVQLNDEAIKEIASGDFAPVEMMVYRKTGDTEIIVTRIRITNPPNEKGKTIADNIYGWEQTPVEVGDVVRY
ncbi:MAG: hypothetical protein ACI4QT_01330 [Kiritimatiellia bacterium]